MLFLFAVLWKKYKKCLIKVMYVDYILKVYAKQTHYR